MSSNDTDNVKKPDNGQEERENDAKIPKKRPKSTTSFKQVVLLVLLANIVLLPAMWYRDAQRPKVLGVADSTDASQSTDNSENTSENNGGLFEWLNFALGNSSPTSADKDGKVPQRRVPESNSVGSVPQKIDSEKEPLRKNSLLLDPDTTTTASTVLKEDVLVGKIVWREGFKARLAAKNVPTGSTVVVTGVNLQPKIIEVDGVSIMPEDIVAVCDKETFIVLGGDPATSTEIQGQVILKK